MDIIYLAWLGQGDSRPAVFSPESKLCIQALPRDADGLKSKPNLVVKRTLNAKSTKGWRINARIAELGVQVSNLWFCGDRVLDVHLGVSRAEPPEAPRGSVLQRLTESYSVLQRLTDREAWSIAAAPRGVTSEISVLFTTAIFNTLRTPLSCRASSRPIASLMFSPSNTICSLSVPSVASRSAERATIRSTRSITLGSSETPVSRLPKLAGDGLDWVLFKAQFKATVSSKGLLRFLEGRDRKPAAPTAKGVDFDADDKYENAFDIWTAKHEAIRALLFQTILQTLKIRILSVPKASDAWNIHCLQTTRRSRGIHSS
ncbi:predicted protein [Postia placenta Mad-698-R]|nr:predicted protein [Postia placenta Mad-698-R]